MSADRFVAAGDVNMEGGGAGMLISFITRHIISRDTLPLMEWTVVCLYADKNNILFYWQQLADVRKLVQCTNYEIVYILIAAK
jgi:hypothetical protein